MQERKKEEKDGQRARRAELGKFFYDLAKTAFAVMVVGNIVGIFGEEQDTGKIVAMVVLGIVSTALLAFIGDRTLKR